MLFNIERLEQGAEIYGFESIGIQHPVRCNAWLQTQVSTLTSKGFGIY